MDNEEFELAENLSAARMEVQRLQSAKRMLDNELNKAKKVLGQAEIDCIAYMKVNGVVDTENFKLTISTAIDIADVAAVPPEYLRVKTTVEPNKIKIKEDMPEGNWYVLQKRDNVLLKPNGIFLGEDK